MALGLAAFLPLSGCDGGTTTEGGNPGIVLRFREGDRDVAFKGSLQFFAGGANPEFVTDPPGEDDPVRAAGGRDGAVPTHFLTGLTSYFIGLDTFASLINPHPFLGLRKASAGARSFPEIPEFNVVLDGTDNTVGYLAGVHVDSGDFDGDGRLTLIIRISRGRDYTGSVDNSTPAGRALALFVPGTTFYARVKDDDGFTFTGIPEGKLPLRWVSVSGIVHAMADSLGEDWTRPLQPGARQDSIHVPPVLGAPVASPPGKFSFSDSVDVVLTAQAGAAIRYTLDGSAPADTSPLYTGPIRLRSSRTLKAAAFLRGWLSGPASVDNYELVPERPVATPAGTSFRDSLAVLLSVKTRNAVIRYTLDGSDPGGESALVYHFMPIVLTRSTTLKAMATVPGLDGSRVLEEKYILVSDSVPPP